MHRLENLARIIGLLGIAVALSACSAIKLGYSTLPRVATWWLDGYVDLSDAQEQRVREDFARLQLWHRKQELPRFVALLQQAERLAAADMSAEQACAIVPQVRQRLLAVAEHGEPAATTLALVLEPEQLSHLERKYQKNNRSYRNEWVELAAADLKEKRFRQFLDRIETIYGRLDEPQRESLRRQMDATVFDAQANLVERQRRQREILDTLRKLAGQPVPLGDARAAIQRVLERGFKSPDPRYRAYQEALIQEGCRSLASVHQGITPRQREHAVRRLRAYQRELEELAGEP